MIDQILDSSTKLNLPKGMIVKNDSSDVSPIAAEGKSAQKKKVCFMPEDQSESTSFYEMTPKKHLDFKAESFGLTEVNFKSKDGRSSLKESTEEEIEKLVNIDKAQKRNSETGMQGRSSNTTQPKKRGFLDFRRLDEDFELPNDSWERQKTMGQGAYGKVMECFYKPLKQTFAVKRFEQVSDSEQRGTRLLRELTILSRVQHSCLNKLVTVFPPKNLESFNEAYLVLDKCDMDLKKLLKSNKYLEEIQCKSIIYDILCGLHYLHKAFICHRDLKPENILVNDDCTIQICDFGLSRSLKD